MRTMIYNPKQRVVLIKYVYGLTHTLHKKGNEMYVQENSDALALCLEEALLSLDEESKRIITYDFKFPVHTDWWREYYSRSCYYRLKNIATEKFITYLHNI